MRETSEHCKILIIKKIFKAAVIIMIQLDLKYLLSLPYGILRSLAIIISLIVMLCITIARYNPTGTGLIWLTAVFSCIVSTIFLVFYILHVPETSFCARIPWVLTEFGFSCLCAIFNFMSFIASCVISNNNTYVIGGGSTHVAFGISASIQSFSIFGKNAKIIIKVGLSQALVLSGANGIWRLSVPESLDSCILSALAGECHGYDVLLLDQSFDLCVFGVFVLLSLALWHSGRSPCYCDNVDDDVN
uniref:MARVEL domain-containing protein n=1 Tax=Romanomermis culicivorax TaxID=13658 RepID=A0A915J667_ROMCU